MNSFNYTCLQEYSEPQNEREKIIRNRKPYFGLACLLLGLLIISMMILKLSSDTKICEEQLDHKISESSINDNKLDAIQMTTDTEILMTSAEDTGNSIVTNYAYYQYEMNKENTGLQYDITPNNVFLLNGKEFRILSGSIHYFRVRPEYWRDRLKKLRAMGANTVETYIAWNLHEPMKDVYEFGEINKDIDFIRFIKMAQEEDLFVIIRPGPYICAEWDFGGMPSYLLREPGIKLRSMDPRFLNRVRLYFNNVLPLLEPLQFIDGQGPIIMFGVENELAVLGANVADKEYLRELVAMYRSNGLRSPLFTADDPSMGSSGSLIEDGILYAANILYAGEELRKLTLMQPNKPLMVMEWWTGWFDTWAKNRHNIFPANEYEMTLQSLLDFPVSLNLFMFSGGTSWGFYNGANLDKTLEKYTPDTTSYDYDAPLTEGGDYTAKYWITRKYFLQVGQNVNISHPTPPEVPIKIAYDNLPLEQQLSWHNLVSQIPLEKIVVSPSLIPMEDLEVNNGSGQSFGYTLYRQPDWHIPMDQDAVMRIQGRASDIAIVMINQERQTIPLNDEQDLIQFGFWKTENAELLLNITRPANNIDILVENTGRVNYWLNDDFKFSNIKKGLGTTFDNIVTINNERPQKIWLIYAMEFERDWMIGLTKFESVDPERNLVSPTLYQFTLSITNLDDLRDTYLDMQDWTRGVVFVNGFNLGRYSRLSPYQSLYLPAPLLHLGQNKICVFEHYRRSTHLSFSDKPICRNFQHRFSNND
uniref:Beta-galactosidase-1-like protein 2 n=4 Tax=Cacopsylla melanoneura TaxID=428564 RepID=A0A8D8SS88_9HEMI